MAKNNLLSYQSVLWELEKCTSQENVNSLLSLNEIISLSQEETIIPNNLDWIHSIMFLFENNIIASDICLKILVNTSIRHEEVRSKLLENNIFFLLTVKLRKETDFWKSDLIQYSALMVVLIQGDIQAQNQMRISGCLSSMIYILSCILDEAENKPLPYKNTELIIYTIIASSKNPRHLQNQTEIGWIIPKVLEYLKTQANFSDEEQFQLIKCFWFFLKNALEKNESNQKIFLKSSGVSVLFRSIQEILKEESWDEKGDLMVKITGTLLKMRKEKEFLFRASHYCPVMILCDLLKTCNTLVVQQTVIFLQHLIQEFPHTLEIINTMEVQKQIKKIKEILTKNKTTAQLYHNLKKRIDIFDELLTFKQPFGLIFPKNNLPEVTSGLEFVKNHFCVIHDVDLMQNSQVFPELYNILLTEKDKMKYPLRIFYEKLLREKEKKLKTNIMQNVGSSKQWRRLYFNVGRFLRKKIAFICQKFISFFDGVQRDGFNKRILH